MPRTEASASPALAFSFPFLSAPPPSSPPPVMCAIYNKIHQCQGSPLPPSLPPSFLTYDGTHDKGIMREEVGPELLQGHGAPEWPGASLLREGRKTGRRTMRLCEEGTWNDSSRAHPPSLPPSFKTSPPPAPCSKAPTPQGTHCVVRRVLHVNISMSVSSPSFSLVSLPPLCRFQTPSASHIPLSIEIDLHLPPVLETGSHGQKGKQMPIFPAIVLARCPLL